MIHADLLRYARGRFLWWALATIVASSALYATQRASTPPNGGTWQGYVLGTAGALLIAWLALLGIRKRRYASTLGSVRGWTSAHVYLGSALLVVATLHSAAQLGWNVHTLAYILMWLVVLSGMFGAYVYLSFPQILARNREGGARAQLFAELLALDTQSRQLAERCSPDVAVAIASAVERTQIGGGVAAQLFGIDRSFFLAGADQARPATNGDQQAVIDFVAQRVPRAEKKAETAVLQEAVVLLCRRQIVLRRIRRDIRLSGWLAAWLYVHVPTTIALVVALMVHIVVTFLYW